jgi:ElaB/YqjD/DUF883 family membrane-anchored ribosome-binding protein
MGQDKGQASTDVGGRDPEQIKEEIEETRQELGDTVAAVAQKADVKKQAKAKVTKAKAKATAKKDAVKDKAGAKKDEVVDKVGEAAPESAHDGAQQASRAAQAAAQQVTQTARENPLPSASIAAFAGGLLIGWILWRR